MAVAEKPVNSRSRWGSPARPFLDEPKTVLLMSRHRIHSYWLSLVSAPRIQDVAGLLKQTVKEWLRDDTFRFAAALAFYTIFSVAPLLLITVGVASLFVSREVAAEGVVSEVQAMVGQQGAQVVRDVLNASTGLGKSIWAIAIGVVTLFLGASAVFVELQRALNQVWDVKVVRSGGEALKRRVFNRFRSFTIALGVGFLMLVSLLISAAISFIQAWMDDWMPGLPWLWQAANTIGSFLVAQLLFAMIYKYLPDVKIGWRDVWVGAGVTAVLFTLGKYFIGLYLGQSAPATAFGAAGSFAVLLLWVYYSALISFFGAEFTQVFSRRYGSRIEPEDYASEPGKQGAKTEGLTG